MLAAMISHLFPEEILIFKASHKRSCSQNCFLFCCKHTVLMQNMQIMFAQRAPIHYPMRHIAEMYA